MQSSILLSMGLLEYLQISIALIICLLCTYHLTKSGLARIAWPHPHLLDYILPWFLLNLHRLHYMFADLMQRRNGTFLVKGSWFGSMDFLITADPANIHYMITSNHSNYPKGLPFRKVFDFMGDAMFNCDEDLWRRHRRTVQAHISNPNYTPHSIKTIYAKLEQGLITLLEDASIRGLILDMQDVFQRLALDITCLLVTGYDPQSLFLEVSFSKALVHLLEAAVHRIALPDYIWKLQRLLDLGEEKKLRQARAIVDPFIYNIISRKQQVLSSTMSKSSQEDEGFDMLTSYMKEVATLTQGVDTNHDKFLRDSLMHLLIAGRDTVSAAMTWTLWLIVSNPENEAKIRAELRASIAITKVDKGHIFHVDEIKKLVYLQATLCESLRLFPSAPLQFKVPVQPDVLPSGHHVHAKTKIVISLYAMARMKEIWGDDCSKFKPERWITDQGTIKHEPSHKFFTFYAGPRICQGKDSAFTQLKMVIATLIHNFQFQLVEDHNIHPDFSAILHMKHGLKVKLQKRWT